MGFRLPVLLMGTQQWGIEQCEKWVLEHNSGAILWCSNSAPKGAWVLAEDRVNHELGRESDAVIFDLYSGCNVDALASVVGTIRCGGCLILICPAKVEWSDFSDPYNSKLAVEPRGIDSVKNLFLLRMLAIVESSKHTAILSQNSKSILPDMTDLLPANVDATKGYTDDMGCKTQQQRQAVELALKQVRARCNRPLVIEADRGRGKSAAIGIALNQRITTGTKVAVTAPRPQAVETLMEFAGQRGELNELLSYFSPDHLLQTKPQADLLVVDEAAAIAPNLLAEMISHYPRTILSTTVQGYEGTGRGFELRFKPHLDQFSPGWKHFYLDEPIRWNKGDWLEALINKVLLFEPEPKVDDSVKPNTEALEFHEFHYSLSLMDSSEEQLSAIFNMLVSAHYRTRPNDLRTLLDAANIRTFRLMWQGNLLAVAMVAEEGQLQQPLAEAILRGERRPKGQNLPQTIAVHCHQPQVLEMKLWRVVRIAVAPEYQSQGIGSYLLQALQQQASDEGVDLIGSLFSATSQVLRFWHLNQYCTIRAGYTAESTTGCYTNVVVKGLSQLGVTVEQNAQNFFGHDFPLALIDTHRKLQWDVVMGILGAANIQQDVLETDAYLLEGYINGSKVYENVAPSLWRWLYSIDHSHFSRLSNLQLQLLVFKVLQAREWSMVIESLHLTGKKQAHSLLRQTFKTLYDSI